MKGFTTECVRVSKVFTSLNKYCYNTNKKPKNRPANLNYIFN